MHECSWVEMVMWRTVGKGEACLGSCLPKGCLLFVWMVVKMPQALQRNNCQSTMICLFNDYDVPLSHVAFITLTHLGQEKWALGSNTGRCPSVNRSNGSSHSAILSLKLLIGVSVKCLIFHPHPFCWMYFIFYFYCVKWFSFHWNRVAGGIQVHFKTTEIKLPSIFQFHKTINRGIPSASPIYLASGGKKSPKDKERNVLDFAQV